MSATIGDFVADGVSADRLGALYEAHAADALRLAYLLTGDRAVAQDLVQDAFVKMAGRLAHLRRAEAFGAYLRVTVVNLARMRGRRLKVERDYLARHTAELVEPHEIPTWPPPRACGWRWPACRSSSARRSSCGSSRTCRTRSPPRCSGAGRRRCDRSSTEGWRRLRAELGEWVP